MPQPRKLHDEFFKKAKAEGYAARSAYKLLEIQEKRKILGPRMRVLDLGCAPGSWLQVAEKLVGQQGRVIGLDLKPVEIALGSQTTAMVADAFTADPAMLMELAGGPFDVVLSDMAPNTTGHGDDLLSARLCRRVIEVAYKTLRPGGALVMKILEGSEYPAVLSETKDLFQEARGFKPKASRDVSREMFVVGTGFRGAGVGA